MAGQSSAAMNAVESANAYLAQVKEAMGVGEDLSTSLAISTAISPMDIESFRGYGFPKVMRQ
ncbi:uncharacterized protein N7477_009379 [Penicillium maclennaniae]|uniref:uncharacterized protein n=1 Tax=Penicillium maclennaniae TaxID=1343394 RepID=UPI00254058FF|nr:uncharacterized protein N7477_009379 [Penicillium maclennaniae]KAJ5661763.1 hypothetical protein N7477_009379 [Penicillium maclennaniae]